MKKENNEALKIISETLKKGLKENVSKTIHGKQLQKRGWITKKGKTSLKGRIALEILGFRGK